MKRAIDPVAGAMRHDPKRPGGWHPAAIRTGDPMFLPGYLSAAIGQEQPTARPSAERGSP